MEFAALEKDPVADRYAVGIYSESGGLKHSVELPLKGSRKMALSKTDQVVVVLAQDELVAASLESGQIRTWGFADGERLFGVNDGVIAQSNDGSMVLVSNDLVVISLGQKPEIGALNPDRSAWLERRDKQHWRLARSDGRSAVWAIKGHGVIASLWRDNLLWLSESSAPLRAFDIENGTEDLEVLPVRGWHYDLLAFTEKPKEIVAAATNFENGRELQIDLRGWSNHTSYCARSTHLKIGPVHRAFVGFGNSFVSGTREIFDCFSGKLIASF